MLGGSLACQIISPCVTVSIKAHAKTRTLLRCLISIHVNNAFFNFQKYKINTFIPPLLEWFRIFSFHRMAMEVVSLFKVTIHNGTLKTFIWRCEQYWGRYRRFFSSVKLLNSDSFLLCFCIKNSQFTIKKKPQLVTINFGIKTIRLHLFFSDKGLGTESGIHISTWRGTCIYFAQTKVLNQAIISSHGGSSTWNSVERSIVQNFWMG